MPSPTLRPRPAFRLAGLAALAAGLLAVPAGCETFRPDPPPDRPPTPAADKIEAIHRGAEPSPASAPPAPVATAPGKHATRRGSYVFYHDFELEKTDPLFVELEALPDRVFGELHLPPSNTIIQVFLFDTQERYERYMRIRYRDLPNRRAYFIAEARVVGAAEELKVFTWMGEHIWTDLRHELTHALLHGVLKDVPIWLDEGLAGYFELPAANSGVNPQHLEILRRGPFLPDLARLERLDKVRQMEKPEYREAWAWVHLMLRSTPETKRVLLDYLQALRMNPNPGPLMPRLQEVLPEPELALAEHLARVELPRTRPRAAAPR